MRKKNNNAKWNRVMALLLSGVMVLGSAPTGVLAAEPEMAAELEAAEPDAAVEPEVEEVQVEEAESEEVVVGDEIEEKTPTIEENVSVDEPEENKDEKSKHNWTYEVKEDWGFVLASCKVGDAVCREYPEGIKYTLNVEDTSFGSDVQVIVSACNMNGEKDLSDDEKDNLGISYKIKYFQYGEDEEKSTLEKPTQIGKYRVEIVFGEEGKEVSLGKDFEIKVDHEIHTWSYKKENPNKIKATCQGGEEVFLTLKADNMTYSEQNEVYAGASVLVNKQKMDETWGIQYSSLAYSKWNEGKKTYDKIDVKDIKDAGKYRVEAFFGTEEDAPSINADFQIFRAEKVSERKDVKIMMSNYQYGAAEVGEPNLENKPEDVDIIGFFYYKDKEDSSEMSWPQEITSTSLDAGKYYIFAKYNVQGGENYIYKTIPVPFEITKGNRDKSVKVKRKDCDIKGKKETVTELIADGLERDAQVTYYYNTKKSNSKGKKWSKVNLSKLKAGTYYMYAVINETKNYNKYTTPVTAFKVYADHRWVNQDNMPNKLTTKEVSIKQHCSCCGEKITRTVKLPKSTVTVTMGQSKLLVSKNTGCTFKVEKLNKQYSRYFSINNKTGKADATKINTSVYAYMPTSIMVKANVGGKEYQMNVQLKIPAPKGITIKAKKDTINGIPVYRFIFNRYKINGANRIYVSLKKGETDNIRKILDKYVSSPVVRGSYPCLNLTRKYVRETMNNKVTFEITAWYGKDNRKSEVFTQTVKVN